MKVSVIVPTYNRAHVIKEAIVSILSQTFTDFELIVVDNESTDNTEEVIKSYTDHRIRYFKNQNSGVVAVNRNYGINKARGEYIAFCDDDDLWMPEKLERQIEELEKDLEIGLVCTNGIKFDENGQFGEMMQTELNDSGFTFESLIWGNRIACSSVLVRKEVLNDIGIFDESREIFTAEDYELWLRIARKYRVKYLDIPLIKYRIHSGAYGDKRAIESIQLKIAVYRSILNKGIIDYSLYKNLIDRRNRQLLLLRTPGYKGAVRCCSALMRIFRIIAKVSILIVAL